MSAKILTALADEYLESARLQTEIIRKYNERKLKAIKSRNRDELLICSRALSVLYSARRDLLDTAELLRGYYDRS